MIKFNIIVTAMDDGDHDPNTTFFLISPKDNILLAKNINTPLRIYQMN